MVVESASLSSLFLGIKGSRTCSSATAAFGSKGTAAYTILEEEVEEEEDEEKVVEESEEANMMDDERWMMDDLGCNLVMKMNLGVYFRSINKEPVDPMKLSESKPTLQPRSHFPKIAGKFEWLHDWLAQQSGRNRILE